MPARLLLIEDNPGDAAIFREKIGESALDADLVHVVRLREALDRLAAEAFDLAFVDLSLPDAQGLEALERVREAAPDLPLIVLTGLDDSAAAAGAKKLGVVDYLVKWYVDGPSLARYVRYATEQQRAEAPSYQAPPPALAAEPAGGGAPPEDDGVRAEIEERTAASAVAPEPTVQAVVDPPEAEAASLLPALEAALDVATQTAARAEHLAVSLRAVLDLARAGSEAPAPEPLDLLPLAQQAVDRARARALHAGIPVPLQSDRKRAIVTADRQALCQVLDRLVALGLETGSAAGVRLVVEGTPVTLRAVWELRRGARLPDPDDPLLDLDLDLCRRLAARAGGTFTLSLNEPEATARLTFDAPPHA